MTRRTLLITGVTLLMLAGVLGVLIVLSDSAGPLGIDASWNRLMAQIRQYWMLSVAHVLNSIGGGWIAIFVVPPLVIVVLVALRRWRQAVFAAAAFAASAALTQVLKHIFGRARPDDMLVASDFGSFPSGHTANAATLALVLWLIAPRVWVAIVGALWVVVMALSRTILAVHWGTDTVGGALVGASGALLVAAIFVGWASLGWSRPSALTGSEHAEDPPLPRR